MISWIQTVLLKHNRVLMVLLLAVIIVAFVFTIGNTGSGGGGGGLAEPRMFYGVDLNDRAQQDLLSRKTQLSMALNMDRSRVDREQLQRAMLERAVALYLASELQLPSPTSEQLKNHIQSVPAFRNFMTGEFDPARYQQTKDQVVGNQASAGLLELVLAEDARIALLRKALAGPGYTLPYQAKLAVRAQDTAYDWLVAELDFETFEPEIDTTEADLRAYYQENKSRYKTLAQVEVVAVTFPATEYFKQIDEPSEAVLREYIEANRELFLPDETTEELPEDLPSGVRLAAQSAWQMEQARKKALEAADAFTMEVYDAASEGDLDPKRFQTFVQQQLGKTPEPLEPILRRQPTPQPGYSVGALTQATHLISDPLRFTSDAVETDAGAVVFAFVSDMPPQVQPFEAVDERVEDAYRRQQKVRLFREKGEALKAQLAEQVAAGTPFKEAAEAAGLSVRSLEQISFASPEIQTEYLLMEAVQGLQAGEISDMVSDGTKGQLVYIANKRVPELTEDNAAVLTMAERLDERTGQLRAFAIIDHAIRSGLERLESDEPRTLEAEATEDS
jgi:peptidyl-prolyl cis-trans isomerase D